MPTTRNERIRKANSFLEDVKSDLSSLSQEIADIKQLILNLLPIPPPPATEGLSRDLIVSFRTSSDLQEPSIESLPKTVSSNLLLNVDAEAFTPCSLHLPKVMLASNACADFFLGADSAIGVKYDTELLLRADEQTQGLSGEPRSGSSHFDIGIGASAEKNDNIEFLQSQSRFAYNVSDNAIQSQIAKAQSCALKKRVEEYTAVKVIQNFWRACKNKLTQLKPPNDWRDHLEWTRPSSGSALRGKTGVPKYLTQKVNRILDDADLPELAPGTQEFLTEIFRMADDVPADRKHKFIFSAVEGMAERHNLPHTTYTSLVNFLEKSLEIFRWEVMAYTCQECSKTYEHLRDVCIRCNSTDIFDIREWMTEASDGCSETFEEDV